MDNNIKILNQNAIMNLTLTKKSFGKLKYRMLNNLNIT